MKRQIITRLLKIGLSATLTMGLLTGCGEEKNVDYTIEGTVQEEASQSNVGKSGLTQFEGEEKWEEAWTVETEEAVTEIQVNAKIVVPKVEQMSVIEVEEPEFDEEYKEQVAKNLFDNEEIYYGHSLVQYIPKKDLLELIDTYKELVATTSGAEKEMWQETLKAYEAALDTAKETYTKVERYTENEYTGMYEGLLYDLSFEESPEDYYNRRQRQIVWEAKSLYEVCPEKFKKLKILECSPWMLGDLLENQCQMSEEEALKEAKAFVERLGLDYSVNSDIRPLAWGTVPENLSLSIEKEPENWGLNGYVISFDLGVDDISFVNFGIEEDYTNFMYSDESEESQYSFHARLQVYITDRGVIRMIADNPMEITGVSEGVELLPLDTMKSIIKEAVNEQCDTFIYPYVDKYFDGMELIYFRVRDKENSGKYSYVPAWRFASVTKNTVQNRISILNPVLVNAIDGSVIDFYDET